MATVGPNISLRRQGPIPSSSSHWCVFLHHETTLKNLFKHLLPQRSTHQKDNMCQGISIKCRFKCRDYHPNHLGVTEHQKAAAKTEQSIN